jgi:hypothetical protein
VRGVGGERREREREKRGTCGQRQRSNVCVCVLCVNRHGSGVSCTPVTYFLFAPLSLFRTRARVRALSLGTPFPDKSVCPSFHFPGEEVGTATTKQLKDRETFRGGGGGFLSRAGLPLPEYRS